MQRVFTSPERAVVGFLKSVLEEHDIACMIKNEFLAGGVGEIPPQECWVELWVIEDSEVTVARRLISTVWNERSLTGACWRCPRCGELIEPQFDACWRCAEGD